MRRYAKHDHRLQAVRDAAGELERQRRVLHARVLEARSADLFGYRCSLRDVADAAGMNHETVRKLAETPVVPA